MKIEDHYRQDRDETDNTKERQAVWRAYMLAIKFELDARGFEPNDPIRWRTAAVDSGLPEPYSPAWRTINGDDLLALYDTLTRARSAGEE